ncbi:MULTISPECIES: 2-oxo acid dehydrogenase subunit E2 [Pseudofrankia]|uniref:2-oxo acid dehydrogenase subunit E2 n=1 Tax=Pseudofrankia TaxID=2994363 RepID=UPI0009F1727E
MHGRLARDELTDPAITVTNLGELGVDSVLPVIYPPQVAMVGLGRISEPPWAVDGCLGVRPAVTVTLAADHRASDGHRGGAFLSSLADWLGRPENRRQGRPHDRPGSPPAPDRGAGRDRPGGRP